jgi:hypothetical protein
LQKIVGNMILDKRRERYSPATFGSQFVLEVGAIAG